MLDTNRPRIRPQRVVALVLLLGFLPSPPTLGDERCPDGNLLAGRLPREPGGVLHPERLTDGVAAVEGDDWQVDLAATLRSDAVLSYDLGRAVHIRSAFLQGDHPGPNVIESSVDGRAWVELWRTPVVEGTGLRSRTTSGLDRTLRYLRVVNPRPREASGLTELQMSCSAQDAWPTVEVRAGSMDLAAVELRERYRQQQAGHKLNVGLLGGIGFVSLLLAARRTRPAFGSGLVPAGMGLLLLYATALAFRQPVEVERWLQFAGVAVAAIALGLTVHRMLPARGRAPEDGSVDAAGAVGSIGAGLYALATGVIYGALHWTVPLILVAVTAASSVAFRGARSRVFLRLVPLGFITLAGAYSAANFGTFFQWRDVATGIGADAELNSSTSWGVVLHHDQFHYYLGSKFYPELRYHLLYDCVALAELENGRGAAIETSRIRNLRDNRMEPGGVALRRAAVECPRAFSPERWQAFRGDVDYFRTRVERSAAERYLTDHGYNATPLWTAVGGLIASQTSASDRSTRLLAALDVAYLACCALLIAWAFATEAAALAALVWGVGQGWFYVSVGGFGSFSRFDWLLAAVAGVCLLKKQMGRWGGLALVASSLLRVFPAALFFGPGTRGLYQLVRHRRLDLELRRILLGSLVGLALLVPFSILGSNGGSHGDFIRNSAKHADTPLSNYMGLRTMFSWDAELRERLLAGTDPDDQLRVWKQQRDITFGERRVWYLLAAAALIGLTVLLSLRSSETWLITLAGVVPMFCLFELTNYFYAIMALFAVWAYRDPRHAAVLITLALGSTVVFLHLRWRALAYVADSWLVLGVLVYFLANVLLPKRAEETSSPRPVYRAEPT
jgi:hypothetical protein